MRLAKTRIGFVRLPFILWGGLWGLSIGLNACSNSLLEGSPNQDSATDDSSDTGTLVLTANGEDFVREGLLSKDEWQVSFDHVYVTFDQAIASQSDALNIDLATLEQQLSPEDAASLAKTLPGIGHVGEGHCEAGL